MRIAFHEVAVLEDAGFSLFGVDDEVFWRPGSLARPFPLGRGREVRASAAAESRRLHGLGDVLGAPSGERLGQGGVGAAAYRVSDVLGVHGAAARGQLASLATEEVGDVGIRLDALGQGGVEEGGNPVSGGVGQELRGPVWMDDRQHGRGPAEPRTSRVGDCRLQSTSIHFVLQRVQGFSRAHGEAARAHGNDESQTAMGEALGLAKQLEIRRALRRPWAIDRGESEFRSGGVQHLLQIPDTDAPARLVVDLDDRGHRAVERAVEWLEGCRAVRGRPRCAHSKSPLELREAFEPAADPA